jgi:hypothetical protein
VNICENCSIILLMCLCDADSLLLSAIHIPVKPTVNVNYSDSTSFVFQVNHSSYLCSTCTNLQSPCGCES